ncbi:MAG: ornithine carbamoyltransferase [Deltaproteobacteria bacterium]|nr:ornithine carbamoyltransferase [Deltaproteobacteria bacterium]MCB9785742.1 ornithine carbamoyltransferase [Deltaproteobacteria bacterium]
MDHFLSLHDVDADALTRLLDLADQLKRAPRTFARALEGKSLAMIFLKASTRTRVSFEVGMWQLGGTALFLSSRDVQLHRGEPVSDTAKVLSRYVDGIMARVFAHQDVLDLARFGTVPVINGLTDLLHPCQALADLQTIRERFGRLRGLKLAYIGDGNNMAHSLMFACAKAGMDFACAAPEGYTMDRQLVADARQDAARAGTQILETSDPLEAAEGAHVVYTDVWASMGQEEEAEARRKAFVGFEVDDRVMARAAGDGVFMHCLPAHRGEEVSAAVCDGERSIIFDQAENRLHAQKAVLVTLLGDPG